MSEPNVSADGRRENALLALLLLVASAPPVLDWAIVLPQGTATLFRAQQVLDFGWNIGGAVGLVSALSSWVLAIWGIFLPPLLAVLALVRAVSARRAAMLTAIYIALVVLIRTPWSCYVNAARPLAVAYVSLEVWFRSVVPGSVPLVLAWLFRRQRQEPPWRWGVVVTRRVQLCVGILGLLLVGLSEKMVSGSILFAGQYTYAFHVHRTVLVAAYGLQLCCALFLVRYGHIRRRWLWLATAGTLCAWGLSLISASILERVPMLQMYDFRERWFCLHSRLGSLAVVAGALLWYWWPVLLGRVRPQVGEVPLCSTCGYNLTGNISGRCPECGGAIAAGTG